jgi:TIR domain
VDSRTKLFISYSHKDIRWLEALKEQLAVLERERLLDVYEDTQLRAGEKWYDRLNAEMSTAKVGLLLISAPFLSSDFIRNEEVPKLFNRHEKGGMFIYPLLVRPCPWEAVDWLSKLQVRPQDAMRRTKAISAYSGAARDQVLADVANEIARLVKDAETPTNHAAEGSRTLVAESESPEERALALAQASLDANSIKDMKEKVTAKDRAANEIAQLVLRKQITKDWLVEQAPQQALNSRQDGLISGLAIAITISPDDLDFQRLLRVAPLCQWANAQHKVCVAFGKLFSAGFGTKEDVPRAVRILREFLGRGADEPLKRRIIETASVITRSTGVLINLSEDFGESQARTPTSPFATISAGRTPVRPVGNELDFATALPELSREFRDAVRMQARLSEPQKDAIRAVFTAVDVTRMHLRRLREVEPKNYAPDAAVVDLWREAAIEVYAFNPELSIRLRRKAEFWSDPKNWDRDECQHAYIQIDDLADSARKLLQLAVPSPRSDQHVLNCALHYATEDDATVAQPLAHEIIRYGATHLSFYNLNLGDSLRARINDGLSRYRYGVVVLSPSFFAKQWPMREVRAFLALEDADGRKRLLPVWHQVDVDDVMRQAPLLRDCLGVSTKLGIVEVARQILTQMRSTAA